MSDPDKPRRLALGLSYDGGPWLGWQSQLGGQTVQDRLESALAQFVGGRSGARVVSTCAGRTDTGVHALNQVVHIDPPVAREPFSWLRGVNRYLPRSIALQWCVPVDAGFHARHSAVGRRYAYLLMQSPARPALGVGRLGWSFRPLDEAAMRGAAQCLLGTHDFSAFRASECQAKTPVRTLHRLDIQRHGQRWRFDFDGNAFLHHMVRNIVGSLVMVGSGAKPPQWLAQVLASKRRELAAPTFSPDGLYFLGPYYDAAHGLPQHNPEFDFLP